jgi:hypothetical protein
MSLRVLLPVQYYVLRTYIQHVRSAEARKHSNLMHDPAKVSESEYVP